LRIALCDRVRHARYGLHLIPPRELVELPPAPATASKPRPVNTSDQLLQRLDAVDENRPFSRSIRPWRCQFIRLTMHERVRREIAAQSLERSQMVVLDALLKLRQVCCDPRLVSLAAMRKGLSGSRGEASASRWPEVAVPHVQGNPIADRAAARTACAGVTEVVIRCGADNSGAFRRRHSDKFRHPRGGQRSCRTVSRTPLRPRGAQSSGRSCVEPVNLANIAAYVVARIVRVQLSGQTSGKFQFREVTTK